MLYDSIETIPAKLFFKIMETGEVALLTDEDLNQKELEIIWNEIEEQHNEINPNKQAYKTLNLYKKIEALGAKYEAIKLSLRCLRAERNKELENILKGYGYSFSEDFDKSIEKITRESAAIEIKIKRIQKQLPKQKEQDESAPSFDETVLGYGSFTGSGFIDTNKITLTQYYALINIGNQKIKALEKNGKG